MRSGAGSIIEWKHGLEVVKMKRLLLIKRSVVYIRGSFIVLLIEMVSIWYHATFIARCTSCYCVIV